MKSTKAHEKQKYCEIAQMNKWKAKRDFNDAKPVKKTIEIKLEISINLSYLKCTCCLMTVTMIQLFVSINGDWFRRLNILSTLFLFIRVGALISIRLWAIDLMRRRRSKNFSGNDKSLKFT